MNIYQKFSDYSNDKWLSLLQRSVREPFIEGIEFPRFPHSSIQIGYNGAADEEGMSRAHAFWLYAEGYARALGNPLSGASRVLDVGCGWGRISRLFARDVLPENIQGVDIDPNAITLCKYLGVPGQFTLTKPGAALPFPDGHFSMITASSVFTHLPEGVATGLAAELSRVMAPGCVFVFTVEDESFLGNMAKMTVDNDSDRWRMISSHKGNLESFWKKYKSGEYIYMTTNDDSEQFRTSDVYGDALIPQAWMKKHWANYFSLVAFEPARPEIYQAVVIARKL